MFYLKQLILNSNITASKRHVTDRQGFTLLEVMFAMAVLAIALVAAFQLQSQSISMITGSRFETTASLLAQSKMAELEGAKPDELGSESGDFGDDYPGYTWQVEIEETDIEQVVKIIVTVVNENMTTNNRYQLELHRFVPS